MTLSFITGLRKRSLYSFKWLAGVDSVCVCVRTLQDACRKSQEVCGHNGETYSTICEAYSDRVAVDYHHPCYAVGVVSEYPSASGCNPKHCPPLSTKGCP